MISDQNNELANIKIEAKGIQDSKEALEKELHRALQAIEVCHSFELGCLVCNLLTKAYCTNV